MREFVLRADALDQQAIAAMRDAALGSEYVGNSPLVGTFAASRGFAITLTHAGIPELRRRFGFLWPFFELAISYRSHRALWSWGERLQSWMRQESTNGFYLNLLLVPSGGEVGPHVDATLRRVSGIEDAVPRVVSVLYLQVSSRGSGLLRLSRQGAAVAQVTPQAGAMLHFRGDLNHEITQVVTETGELRASLVLEQYVFPKAAVQRLPAFAVKSQGRFQKYLDDAKHKPTPNFVLE